MEKFYSDLFWYLDAVLFMLVISLSITVIIYAFIKQIIEKNRSNRLASVIKSLQRLTIDNQSLMADGCVALIKDTTPFEFLEITKRKEEILPSQFSGQFTQCINISGRIPLIEKLAQKSKNKWRRIEAIIILGHLNAPHALDILSKSILNRDEDIAYFSILSLGRIKNIASAKILLEAIKRRIFSGYKIASILENFPPLIVEELIKSAKDPDPNLRFWCIKVLSRFRPREYAAKIAEFINDKLPDIRAAVCECLGELAVKDSAGAVKICLKDNVWFVRMHAIRALEKILGKDCIADVAVFSKDPNWWVQESVKRIMIKHTDEALVYIEKLLAEGDQATNKYCVEILNESGYTARILQDIIAEDAKVKAKALQLLEIMIKAKAHFGFESILSKYPDEKRKKTLNIIASIDQGISEHIDKKIKGEIVDV
jgi:HEAT repeat protein